MLLLGKTFGVHSSMVSPVASMVERVILLLDTNVSNSDCQNNKTMDFPQMGISPRNSMQGERNDTSQLGYLFSEKILEIFK